MPDETKREKSNGKAASGPEEVVALLRHIAALSGFDTNILRALAGLCELVAVRPGELVWKAGEVWDALYVVRSGQVQLVNETDAGPPIVVDTLRAEASFGEQCFL